MPGARIELLEKRQLLSQMNLTQYVNPFIGTSPTPNGNGGFLGNTGDVFPGAVWPFGMVQFSPDTWSTTTSPPGPEEIPGGYWYSDSEIRSFSLTHFSGAGDPYGTDLGLMPFNGGLSASNSFSFNNVVSSFSHSNETASPGYYGVTLDTGDKVELTTTTRTGQMQVTFPASTNTGTILLNLSNSINGNVGASATFVSSNEIQGYIYATTIGNEGYTLFYDAVFDQPVIASGTWNDGTLTPGSKSTSFSSYSDDGGAYVSFDTSSNKVVHASIGISYVSIENAQLNRTTEAPTWNFNGYVSAANSTWNTDLNQVQINDPNASVQSLTVFYTELYHTLIDPSTFNDVNGQYIGFDEQIHTVAAGHTQYSNISGWDIYRSETDWLSLLMPSVASDLAQSLLNDASQNGGAIPRWVQAQYDTKNMVGDGGSIIIDDAYSFGATNFNTSEAVTYLNDNGTGVGGLRQDINQYLSSGYVYDSSDITQEYAIADAADAFFFQSIGQTGLYQTYLTRAQNWKNNFDPSNLSLNAKAANGSWDDPTTGWAEGSQAQYTWMVPFNLAGLIKDMGGAAAANKRLDGLFGELNDGSYNSPYEYIGNEDDETQPWTFDYTGEPYQTQNYVRQCQQIYTDAPDGLPGNDDGGEMSSWYLFATLGIDPMSAGSGNFVLGSPLFASATITTGNGHVLQINGNNAEADHPYVQSLSLNGVATQNLWFPVSDILNNATATLNFNLGSTPDTSWGASPLNAPPSYDLSATTPTVSSPAAASVNPVAGTSVTLSALGADTASAGESGLTYTWTTLSQPLGASAPTFSSTNGTNAGKSTVVSFYATGSYTFQVAIYNGLNAVASTVTVTVAPVTHLAIVPTGITVSPGTVTQLNARLIDQFGNTQTSASGVAWSLIGGSGSVTPSGQYIAGSVSGVASVQAAVSSLYAVASVDVVSDVTNGLEAHWAFDEGSGTTTANSAPDAINNTGTLVNGTSWVSPGKIGPAALNFSDSSHPYVEVPDAADLDPTNGLTVSAWVYPLDWNGNHRIVEKGNNANGLNYGDNQYRLTAESNVLKFELYLDTANGFSAVDVTAALPSVNAWHFIAGTWDGTNLNLYVDNVLVATNSNAIGTLPAYGSTADAPGPLFIGNKNDSDGNSGDAFNGNIDDVRIYNRAITAAEVAILYNQTTSALTLTGPANYLRLDSDGVHLDIWNTATGPAGNTPPASQLLISALSAINFEGSGSINSLTLDFSNGDLLSGTAAINFIGASNASNSLTVIGSASSNDAIALNGVSLQFDSRPVVLSNVQTISFTPGSGTDSLSVSSASLKLAIPPGGSANFSSVSVTSGTVALPPTSSNDTIVATNSLALSGTSNSWTGKLDIGNANLIVHGGNFTQIENQLLNGYSSGSWTGAGIFSSKAAADTGYLTALGVIDETASSIFDGQNLLPGDVLIKYTYYGDTDFNGKVDGSDYSRVDYGFLHHLSGWNNGDFNYDGVVNGSDYTLMDNAFNSQAVVLNAQIARPAQQIAAAPVALPGEPIHASQAQLTTPRPHGKAVGVSPGSEFSSSVGLPPPPPPRPPSPPLAQTLQRKRLIHHRAIRNAVFSDSKINLDTDFTD
jgi:predicted alpha-1,2-mannosidase